MLDDATRAHAVSGLITRACPSPVGVIVSPRPGALGASRVLQRLSSCMPRPEDSGGPPHPSHHGCCVWPARTLRLSASAISLLRSGTSTSGSATSPTAYRMLCVRLPRLVRGLPHSATGPTRDTGGRLTLTRPGLSPGKRRRASLGAITLALSRAAFWRRLERFVRAHLAPRRLSISHYLYTSRELAFVHQCLEFRANLLIGHYNRVPCRKPQSLHATSRKG